MLGTVARVYQQSGRTAMSNFVRNGSQYRGGNPGENLPFDIHNKTRLTITFFLYCLTGIGAPFALFEWQIRKTRT